MRKIAVAMILVAGVMLLMASSAVADSYTTGFTFHLPEMFPLHNVYVVTQGAGDQESYVDIFLPPGTTIPPEGITPAGFSVPTGDSAIDLDPLFLSLGIGAPDPSVNWALAGLWTNESGEDHVVLGTNADLTGVPLLDVLTGHGIFATEDAIKDWMTSGQVGPEGAGIWGGIGTALRMNGYMRPFGETAQLYFFSNGQAIPGGTAAANLLGTPAGGGNEGGSQIPEPGTLMLFSSGVFSLMGYAWRRRRQAA